MSDEKTELKPCPFCGGTMLKITKAQLSNSKTGHSVYIRCKQCFARGPKVNVGDGDGPGRETQAAAEAWNKRT